MSQRDNKNINMRLHSDPNTSYNDSPLLRYKALIKPAKHDMRDIEHFLTDHLEAVKVDFMQLNSGFKNHVLYNINQLIKERNIDVSVSNDDISVYILPKTEITKDYYLNSRALLKIHQDDNQEGRIAVILEPKTEYVESGSAKLFCELVLMLGISQYDYDNNTIKLIDYLSAYKSYHSKQY